MHPQDVFETKQYPIWSWPGSKVFPGGTLTAQASAAAFETVSSDFAIDTVQAYFLAVTNPDLPVVHRVKRLSDGGRFVTRVITAEQKGKVTGHITCSFVRYAALDGRSMVHSVRRQGKQSIDSITLDDLEIGRNEYGPYMKFQRLPLEGIGASPTVGRTSPASTLYTSVAAISPEITTSSSRLHALGIIALSDYHVLDAAPTLHNHSFGLPRINDSARKPTDQDFKMYTSLNHTVHFRRHDGFRADELCYIEVTSPWADRRRAEMQSRIFDRRGELIASCVQEAYYVLKEGKAKTKL